MKKAETKKDIFVKKFELGSFKSNSYLIASLKSKEAAVIDPALPVEEIKETILKEKFKLKCIINTHGHIDHIQGNGSFDAPLYIHKEDAPFLNNAVLNLSSFVLGNSVKSPNPSRLLEEGDIIKIGDICLKVIHTPGHTPGGICLYAGYILFSGDTLFFDSLGRCDFPYGSESSLIKSIKEKLMKLPDETLVYPGHGPKTTIGREKKFNPFL